MKTLGVITTTYNRGYCIHQVYNSLISQKCKDFMWLVIDDGSTDNTKDQIIKFKNEGIIEIEYYWQPNKGMHSARNLAYKKIKTEINVIIDSDDWMAKNVVGSIIKFWRNNRQNKISGIITLNSDNDGNIIGGEIPSDYKKITTEMHDKLGIRGDKKFIYRSDLTRLYPP